MFGFVSHSSGYQVSFSIAPQDQAYASSAPFGISPKLRRTNSGGPNEIIYDQKFIKRALLACVTPCAVQADILVADGSNIVRFNPDDTGETTLISGAATGMFYDSTSEKLYFVGPGDSIRRANRDGTGVETLIADAGDAVVDLVVSRPPDPATPKMIWTDS